MTGARQTVAVWAPSMVPYAAGRILWTRPGRPSNDTGMTALAGTVDPTALT